MALEEPDRFAEFLFNSKLYAGLETSFGKSLENELLAFYPNPNEHWIEPVEKTSELEATSKLERVARARRRDVAVWREIDKSLVLGKKRYLLMIKSGPNTINDTQVAAMKDAIAAHHGTWLDESRRRYHVAELDIVIGIMYGTDWTTNNKENQILVKLMEHGFREDDGNVPGILVSDSHPGVRVYCRIGREFWALVGNPPAPERAQHTFLEIMLGVIAALKGTRKGSSIEALVKAKVVELATALNRIANSFSTFPKWVKDSYTPAELHWLIVALSSFFDEGI